MYSLRPYQTEAIKAVKGEWNKGNRRTLLVMPTGTGKTDVFSSIVFDNISNGGRALIMANRNELLSQPRARLKSIYGLETVLEKAGSTGIGSDIPITVGSVQTMSRDGRLEKFPGDYFETIVIDEAHHCPSASYQRVVSHFPNARVLGVTATPDRGDHKNLGRYFDSMAYEYSMNQAIKDGYLCPIKAQLIPLKLDITNVKVSKGDFQLEEMGTALDPYLEPIAMEMARYGKGRKILVFLPLVKTSQKFCAMLNKYGMRAAEVNGKSKDREEILERFSSGQIDVLCNSMLLTEGFDCPSIDCVVVLRPTKIRALYQQMVGRGTRLAPGKKDLLLLDFLWMTERHDLCRPSSLFSKDDAIGEKMDARLLKDDDIHDLMETEQQAERDVLAERENAIAERLNAMKNRARKQVDPLQYFLSIEAEDLLSYEPRFKWEMAPPTEKQLQLLSKRGIYTSAIDSKGMAAMVIDRLIRRQSEGLATPRQIRRLESYGFNHVGTWSFTEANSMMSRLSLNGWDVPMGIVPELYMPER